MNACTYMYADSKLLTDVGATGLSNFGSHRKRAVHSSRSRSVGNYVMVTVRILIRAVVTSVVTWGCVYT
jgi:hypothetical protein